MEDSKHSQSEYYLALFYCFLTGLIFAYHYFAAKEVMAVIHPTALAATRGVIGGGLLIAIFWKKVIRSFTWDLLKRVFIIAFLGFFINQLFFMKGLTMTMPINASIINNTIPIATSLMAIIIGLEKFGIRKMAGILLGFILIIIITFQKKGGNGLSVNLGDLYIFINVIAFSMSIVLSKKYISGDVPHEAISGGVIFIGGLGLLLFSFNKLGNVPEYTFRGAHELWLMFFEVVLSTSVVYWLNFKALKILSSSKTMVFIYLQPILTAILEYFYYGKIPNLTMGLIFIGILISGYLVLRSEE